MVQFVYVWLTGEPGGYRVNPHGFQETEHIYIIPISWPDEASPPAVCSAKPLLYFYLFL